jgi:hypothetical protein
MENVSLPGISSDNHGDHDFSDQPESEHASFKEDYSILVHEDYPDDHDVKPAFFKDF